MGVAFVIVGAVLMMATPMPFDWAGFVVAFGGAVWMAHVAIREG